MEKTKGHLGGDRYSDPAMGMASFSRVTGNHKLFGSDVSHQHFISLKISHAVVERELSQDWYFASNLAPITEVYMSAAQFADLITHMNMGDGVPVTIRQVGADSFTMPEFPSKGEQFKGELKEKSQKVMAEYRELERAVSDLLTQDKPLNKAEKASLLTKATALSSFAQSSLPFLADQFQENMEKSVAEAKTEVENFVNSTVTKLGIQSLHKLAQIAKDNT